MCGTNINYYPKFTYFKYPLYIYYALVIVLNSRDSE